MILNIPKLKKYFIVSIAAVVLVILSTLVLGYDYGINSNHEQVITFIKKISNPALFPNDYFVNTFNRFPSIYPYVMAFLSKWVELEILHFILYLICKFLLLIFAYSLARFLFKSDKTAIIAMFIFAFSPLVNLYGLLGHDPLMKTSLYQTTIVAPFAIASIIAFLKKRYVIASVIVAFIYYVNALIANFLLILFFVALVYDCFRKPGLKEIKKAVISFILFTILMIPGFLWYMHKNGVNLSIPTTNFLLYIKLWYPRHYFPSFMEFYQWGYFVVMVAFFAIFFRKGFSHCREKSIIRVFLFTLFAMWLFAFIFAEVLPVRTLILLQFLRSDIFFIVFGILFAADYIRSIFEKSIRDIAVGALLILGLIEFPEPRYLVGILAILVTIEFRVYFINFLNNFTYNPEKVFGFIWRIFILLLIMLMAISFFTRFTYYKVGYISVLLLLLLAGENRSVLPRLKFIFTISLLAIVLFQYLPIIKYRIASRSLSNNVKERDADWRKLQLWAKGNTPIDAVFITPVDMNGFRVFSERSVFVDWVDGSAMHWVKGFEYLWAKRLTKVGISETLMNEKAGYTTCFGDSTSWLLPRLLYGRGEFGDSKSSFLPRMLYMRMSEDDFRHIKNEFGVKYAVEYSVRPLSFKAVYENSTFRVYNIE